ncbi:MAG: Nif3-like dinuclear metal center hexameric protein [Clostridiaceae bacterium]|nr:Nif3-like dinuclear metal center hexameric protein [Clostridiaceae bacterium]
MKLAEIISCIENISPVELAEGFDNVGLLIGDGNREVKKVLLCLDVDEVVAREAAEIGADLIISHHPVIFHPLKDITTKTPSGRMVITLIKNNIAVYSAHTNLDTAEGGLNDHFCEVLGLKPLRPLDEGGLGRICEGNVTLEELAKRCKEAFNLPYVKASGDKNKFLSTIAVCTGGGSSLVDAVKREMADCYISGDISYGKARELYFLGISHVEIGHYDSEIIVMDLLEKILRDEFEGEIELIKSKRNINIYNYY